MSEQILIVDDEKEIADLIEVYLKNDGFTVYKFYNGIDALKCIEETHLDLAILDVMLPDIDGFRICQKIREKFYYPVIMLTAKVDNGDKIMGLTIGADDYITKPFNILEVKARIKAIMRRSEPKAAKAEESKELSFGELKINTESRRGYISEKEVNLTAKEFDLLELLMTHPNKVYGREELLNTVWGYEYPGDVRTVDVHIRRLREKIENKPSEPKYIHTKWGVGYYFQK